MTKGCQLIYGELMSTKYCIVAIELPPAFWSGKNFDSHPCHAKLYSYKACAVKQVQKLLPINSALILQEVVDA